MPGAEVEWKVLGGTGLMEGRLSMMLWACMERAVYVGWRCEANCFSNLRGSADLRGASHDSG